MTTRLRAALLALTALVACGPSSDDDDSGATVLVATDSVPDSIALDSGTLKIWHSSLEVGEKPIENDPRLVMASVDCDGAPEAVVTLAGDWNVHLVCDSSGGAFEFNCLVTVPEDAIEAGDTVVACEPG